MARVQHKLSNRPKAGTITIAAVGNIDEINPRQSTLRRTK